ncbi:MAG: flagellar M-ring protein FliF [Candidatus Omnitrophica bacterium]|nr:flagellar M-ring protein FliF [Candidatus Omnitrophota bacterium]
MKHNFAELSKQLLNIWKQLGPNQRVSVLLATGVVFAGVLCLAFWSSRVEYVLLYGRLPETEAAKVIAALDEAKVPYKIGNGGSSILVPSDKVYSMRLQMAGRGIPRGEGVGFEIFDKPNFGLSDFVQRANYLRAVQGELGRTISQLDEVESARVMVVLPENRLLIDKDKHPTASVFVRVSGNGQLKPQAVDSIRFLVANAVEGLKANYVTVVDNRGNVLSENVEDDSTVGLTAIQLAARRNLEQYLAKKTQDMLEKVLGPGQAIVRVAAEINFDTISRVEEKYDPEGQVIRLQTKNDENNDSTTANSSGVVGISANAIIESNASPAAVPPLNSSRNKKTIGNIEYDNSRITSNIIQAAGGIKRLSAAVTVAAQYDSTEPTRKLVPRTPEQIEKLRRIVESALGNDPSRGDQITVEELPFNDQLAVQVTKQLEQQRRWDFWWDLARSGVYPLLGIGALVGFFLLLKRTAANDVPVGMPPSMGNGHGNGHAVVDRRLEPVHGPVTVEVLNQLIKENPQNMTQAIRRWLARGNPPQN